MKIENWKLKITLFATIFLLFFIVAQSVNAAVIQRPPNNLGLVGYWSLDEGRGTVATDFSGGDNPGSLEGGVQWTSGRFGSALEFDGSGDYVDLGDDDAFDLTSAITMSAWINPDTIDTRYSVISKYDTTDNQRTYALDINGENNGDIVVVLASPDGSSFVDITSNSSVISADAWNHVVFTWDKTENSGQGKIYVNGSEVAYTDQGAKTDDMNTNTIPLKIGRTYTTARDYDGEIDDVRIYDRSLSASEISDLYQNTAQARIGVTPKDRFTDGLVSHWTFDGPDVTSSTTTDVFGSNDGTRQGSPVVRAGRIGQAMEFDGSNDYVSVSGMTEIANSNGTDSPFSFSFWANANDRELDHDGFFNILGTAGTNNVEGVLVSFNGSDTSLRVRHWADGGDNITWSSPDIIGSWVHIAVVVDDGNIYIYQDGEQVNNGTFTNPMSLNGGANIGLYNWNSHYLDGSIDDVRIYNKALSSDEVLGLYNATKMNKINTTRTDILTNGLVGHWTFDGPDVTSSTTTDVSVNSNDGTISGATPALGKIGQAMYFDEDTIEHDTLKPLQLYNAHSVGFWVYRTGSARNGGSTSYGGVIEGITGTGSHEYSTAIRLDNTTLRYAYHITTNDSYDASISNIDNRWSHLFVTYDGNNVNFYQDGEHLEEITIGAIASDDEFDMSLGNWGSNYRIIGKLDDFRIYDRALSADEVKRLYELGN